MRLTKKKLLKLITEELELLHESKGSSYYLGFFSKPENRVSDEELEYYLEDPLDNSMPVAVAFNPKMHRERVKYVKAALQQCSLPNKPQRGRGNRDMTPIDLGREEDKLKARLQNIQAEQSPIATKIRNLFDLDPKHPDIPALSKELEKYDKELESIHSRLKEIPQTISDRAFQQSGEAVRFAFDSAAMSEICKALQHAGNEETALRKFLSDAGGSRGWYASFIMNNQQELRSVETAARVLGGRK